MKEFFKSPFYIASIIFTSIGLYTIFVFYDHFSIPESCKYEYEEYLCLPFPFWIPLISFAFAVIFFLGGRNYIKQINRK